MRRKRFPAAPRYAPGKVVGNFTVIKVVMYDRSLGRPTWTYEHQCNTCDDIVIRQQSHVTMLGKKGLKYCKNCKPAKPRKAVAVQTEMEGVPNFANMKLI